LVICKTNLPKKARTKREGGSYLAYLKKWIEKCGAKILVVHLHDCSLTEKQVHLSIGKGELDFDAPRGRYSKRASFEMS